MATNIFQQERKDFAKFHKTAEKQVLPMFRKALADNIKPVIDWVTEFGTDNVPVDTLINYGVWRIVYPKVYEQIGMKMSRKEYYYQRRIEGVEETKASAIQFLVDVWSSLLRDYALTYTYSIERELNDTTIEIIKRALGDVATLELDRLGRVRVFLKDIKDKFRTRSLTISRTEATSASNLGKEIGARSWIDEQGGQGYKLWLGRNDNRERQEHIDENNTIIEIDDKFIVGGEEASTPGDVHLSARMRVNCRCVCSFMSQNRYNQLVKRNRIQGGKVV